MKRNKIMVLMAALALTAVLGFSGCSDKVAAESDAFTEDSVAPLDFPDVETDVDSQNSPSKEEPDVTSDSNSQTKNNDISKTETDSDETASNVTNSDTSNSSETLDGILIQIDTDSFIINKTFTEETEDGLFAASSIDPENNNEADVTVSFTDSTIFKLITVKNAGINPDEDVIETIVTKDSLILKTSLVIKGSTTETGFLATEVGIYNFK